ncbi:hypothetical protein COHA_007729 [Chlorella ohadii]|uniref:Uncharacterized protein n=1 Tax=Chlorella ohadii TaxID=2649997 RepID=A0AAD5DK66_9CHLO|nr:hypothetical protein COHA_007729 [Chlorella ohadii]
MEGEGSEAAGSVAAAAAPSETSAESSGPQPGPAAEESMQQGGSVNWGQATAQSPRVPRSQISRAHPAHAATGFGERTSAVLSALSGDDETALSAAEAAGEHTSEPQEAVAGVGETVAGVPVPAALLQAQLAQQPALSLTAPAPRMRGGFELASSPPASASPMYRANSVVSHTAGAALGGGRMHQQPGVRRGAETPASAPAAAPPGSSPPNSRGEFSGPLPQLRVQRRGAFSAGLPPASGQRPSQQQPLGPSRPSLSAGQSHAAGLSLPSTMAVALGALSPPGGPGGLLGQVTPPAGGLGLQAGQPPGSAGMASLLPLAASMGVPASQLGSMAAALLQAQSSVLGAQQAQHPAGQGGATQQVQQQQQQQQLLPPPPLHKPAAQQAQQQQQQQKAAATPAGTPMLHPTATAVSEIRGSPVQPAAGVQQQQQAEVAAAQPAPAEQQADLAAPQQQAASAVQGSGNGAGSPRRPLVSPSPDPDQLAAEEERRRHEGDPPRPQAAVIVELPTADVAAASQGGGLPGGLPFAEPPEAAMLGGNSTFADAMELGADEDDAMEVQQEPGHAAAGAGGLPPAPHGAASVMATLMTDNNEAQSEGDTEMEQQAASGPSRSAAAAQPERSLSRSMAEPAAATAHNTGARSALTGPPSQQGPATSNHGRAAHALSSLATVSTGNGEGLGGSVEMSALPSQQAAQHATSAPAAFAPPDAVLPAPPLADAVGEAALAAHAAAAAAAAQAAAHAAASAPATVPPQAFVAPPAGAAAQPAAPAASVSMSGQGDTPGGQVFGTGVVAMPQSSAAAAQQAAGGALQEGQGDMAPPAEARSRLQGAPPAAPAPALATIEGLGSPAASMHVAGVQPQESRGTARATILAGAAHSILTTAAAGEGEAMDEGGEALSPLVAAKAQAQMAAAQGAGPAAAAAATPGSGSVGGTPGLLPASASAHPAPGAASSERAGLAGAQQQQQQAVPNGQASTHKRASAGGSGQHTANGYAAHDGPSPAGGAAAVGSQGVASPIDYSTMAVDLAPAGPADAPQPSASYQPSSLPPPGAVAAAMAALEAAQAAQNGSLWQTPPPSSAEQLGEVIQALARQNGYATHANSAIGNGHVATSPDRELTSPSRLLTHDSTGSGSKQQAAKRRRTSAGPAGSAPHA